MSRTYTTRTILNGGQAKEEDFNSEVMGVLQEFNGQLDSHQLPLQQITNTHLAQPVGKTPYALLNGTYSSYMTTQSYHQTEWEGEEGSVYMEYTNNLYAGFSWIKLSALQLQFGNSSSGAELTFDALEGMLAGNAVIDFNWFSGEAEFSNQGGRVYRLYGDGCVIEWGVFVDDVLVSKSGYIWPRRMTLNLPFNAPVSSKPCNIDIRFRVQFLDPDDIGAGLAVDVVALQRMTYQGGNLWVRNQYR